MINTTKLSNSKNLDLIDQIVKKSTNIKELLSQANQRHSQDANQESIVGEQLVKSLSCLDKAEAHIFYENEENKENILPVYHFNYLNADNF
jgi:hypothetical protein